MLDMSVLCWDDRDAWYVCVVFRFTSLAKSKTIASFTLQLKWPILMMTIHALPLRADNEVKNTKDLWSQILGRLMKKLLICHLLRTSQSYRPLFPLFSPQEAILLEPLLDWGIWSVLVHWFSNFQVSFVSCFHICFCFQSYELDTSMDTDEIRKKAWETSNFQPLSYKPSETVIFWIPFPFPCVFLSPKTWHFSTGQTTFSGILLSRH